VCYCLLKAHTKPEKASRFFCSFSLLRRALQPSRNQRKDSTKMPSNNIAATTTPLHTPPSSPRLAPPSQSHIHFGATPHCSPVPRFPSSYSHSNKSYFPSQPQALGTQVTRQNSSSSPRKPAQNFVDMLTQEQLKSMSDLDKEEEARLAKTHREKLRKMGLGISRFVGRLKKSGTSVEKGGKSK
jgi:hypothetical protein